MFTIDKITNRIEKITEKTFSELGFKEREHLQEWIANNPSSLGDKEEQKLLIIQKEFDGFDDTRERLDLLAVDKQGNIVVIENKLDDTGRDVTWQALKYASYCSSLKKQQIFDIYQDYLNKQGLNENSEENILEFFDNEDIQLNQNQRIIFVAANYRKEVTSTVMWLLSKYKLKIQCFKATPYVFGEKFLLNIEQIIPVKEAEDYTIKMAEKAQEDFNSQEELKTRHLIRKGFWTRLISELNTKSNLFQNISPSIYNWIGAGSGVRGVGYNFVISKKYVRVELYIDRGELEENTLIFEKLETEKEIIEKTFGQKLVWEKLEDKRACRIKYENSNVNVFEKENWNEMIQFLIDGMIRFEKAFKEHLKKINSQLKRKNLG
ncbi:DUF4268 domain-containing protein [Tenacibaculum sp. M341]|uniref:DUF4268 domain-containing protein n=1 Tax=Tenacibaculum sp. M341 TaxID=2530339 RepID=UPI00104D2970|nr:DUF4268 domain-containing protein [Tenacibaculum sp. M341]TCI91806.1 DUF4268 domain-containing protein [Tenacibaculum sp. M341]